MNWDGISSVSLYWANLEMIKFWASSSPGKGPPNDQNCGRQFGNWWHYSRVTKFSAI